MTPKFIKAPHAALDYQADWSAWLGDDIILSSTWIVPEGIMKKSDTHTGTAATIWLSGGVDGKDYPIINRIITAGGRTDDRTILIRVRNR